MVDEYQDTNTAQFQLVSLLAARYRNLCVVGDDDQSIYKFRGANIGNILNFEKIFPDAKVIKLEQNYRSTKNILKAANGVIANNQGRKVKTLWTANEEGEKVAYRKFQSAFEEAEFVALDISKKVKQGSTASMETVRYCIGLTPSRDCLKKNFCFQIFRTSSIGGINFYARKEIKDVLAYLKTIDNARDDLAVRRIINVPKRGIGATTIARVQEYAVLQEMNFYDALKNAAEVPGIGRGVAKTVPFVTFIQTLRSKAQVYSVMELVNDLLEQTGYIRELEAEGTEEAKERIENINELINKVAAYEQKEDEPTLSGFLEEVALVADVDSLEDDGSQVVLMTLHSAKGLEFPHVYMAGMEDGIFPSYMCITPEDPNDLEEERRLCYVGITRAMKDLTMTGAQTRMVRGETHYNRVSRFMQEIPEDVLEVKGGRQAGANRSGENAENGRDPGMRSIGIPCLISRRRRFPLRKNAISRPERHFGPERLNPSSFR